MLSDWNLISDELQLTLTQEALRQAAEKIAGTAETLAQEFDAGALMDRGGADALRLLAAIMRLTTAEPALPAAGHA